MPKKKIIYNNDYSYAIWVISESSSELLKLLEPTHFESKNIEKIHHEHRKNQNIAARITLNLLANKKVYLKYQKNGVPYCDEFQFISISHSNMVATVIAANNPIGIDIQHINNKILNISSKFINTRDILLNNEENNTNLHLAWCSKEAIYKTLNGLKCSIKDDIIIDLERKTGAYMSNDKIQKYTLEYELFQDYFITIAKKIV